MGIFKTIDTELQELNFDYIDLANSEDIFDVVIDAKLSNHKLIPVLVQLIDFNINKFEYSWLKNNDEFVSALEWHRG